MFVTRDHNKSTLLADMCSPSDSWASRRFHPSEFHHIKSFESIVVLVNTNNGGGRPVLVRDIHKDGHNALKSLSERLRLDYA